MAGGGERMVTRHRERGKIPVSERIDLLLDPLSPFLELSPLAAWGLYDNAVPGAGLVTGIGTIRGVVCMVIANDATTKGGSFFKETIRKHVRAQDIAFESRLPVVYLVDCGGAASPRATGLPDRTISAVPSTGGAGCPAAGIPQIAAVFGECRRRRLHPALSDEVVMTAGNSGVHLGGPQIVSTIREIVDRDAGRHRMHSTVSGGRSFRARRDGGHRQDRDIVGALSRVQRAHGDIRPARPPCSIPPTSPASSAPT
jgi:3-methylcrotonyl-CoA carboxylase beta subunit